MENLENQEKYLTIGTVVILKDAKKRIMITGFCCIDESDTSKMYDYSACLYPEGIVASDTNMLFNHDQIDKIFALGYSDDEEKEFKENLKAALESANN